MGFTDSRYLKDNVIPRIKVTNTNVYTVVHDELRKLGPGCSLNHIDVSEVTSFNRLFMNIHFEKSPDISMWDTHNVENMEFMFYGSDFDGNISAWDTSNLLIASGMFYNTNKFNCDIDGWELPKIKYTASMFAYSSFSHNLSSWPSKLTNAIRINNMFEGNDNWPSKRINDFYKKIAKSRDLA